jgi:3D (Asp-Asp-Asp) domain-containing protein
MCSIDIKNKILKSSFINRKWLVNKRKKILTISIIALSCIIFGGSVLGETSLEGNSKEEDPSSIISNSSLFTVQNNSVYAVSMLYDPSSSNHSNVYKINAIITAYSSTPWETWGDPFTTASGVRVKDGIVANNLLPFGTKIRIPEIYGDKIFVVEDRMHWMKSDNHFDIWFPDYWQAKNFGVKRTYIEVIKS